MSIVKEWSVQDGEIYERQIICHYNIHLGPTDQNGTPNPELWRSQIITDWEHSTPSSLPEVFRRRI